MKNVSIQLLNIEMVHRFVDVITALSGSFEIISGRTVLDAKSILGIFSLNLSEPLLLRIENDSLENLESLREFMTADQHRSYGKGGDQPSNSSGLGTG